jgi:ADP-ribosylglycohydrolase
MDGDMQAFDEDRVFGAILGCALGDALGLPAEGGDKAILAERYPGGLSLPHKAPVRGFPLNDWTDDLDNTVLVLRAIAAYQRRETNNPWTDYAVRLKHWYSNGFPELGDTQGMGCGNMMWRVLRRDDFETDPFGAAAAIVGPKAGNGALMRTAPCAFTADPRGWAAGMCATTHSDPRCIATCVAQCLLIRELAATPLDARIDPEGLRRALGPATTGLSPAHRHELLEWAGRSVSLDALDIGGRDARGYTLKAFGCALWAFRALVKAPVRDAALFRSLMTQLVMEAGDADTNAAIAGALLGAALGRAGLPADWLAALPNLAWLEAEIRAWLAAGTERSAAPGYSRDVGDPAANASGRTRSRAGPRQRK